MEITPPDTKSGTLSWYGKVYVTSSGTLGTYFILLHLSSHNDEIKCFDDHLWYFSGIFKVQQWSRIASNRNYNTLEQNVYFQIPVHVCEVQPLHSKFLLALRFSNFLLLAYGQVLPWCFISTGLVHNHNKYILHLCQVCKVCLFLFQNIYLASFVNSFWQ